MDDLFSFSRSPSERRSSGHNVVNHRIKVSTTESSFFGLAVSRHSALTCSQRDPTGECRWSPFPPYRFAVEFWDIACLKDKCRLYSYTVWYGGSLFNIYIQILRKKEQAQLGIYLHRQSSTDPIPAPSSPSLSSGNGKNEGPPHMRDHSFTSIFVPIPPVPSHHAPLIRPVPQHSSSDSTTAPPSVSPASSCMLTSGGLAILSTSTPLTPPQPFRDHRSSVAAYFSVSCASATGSSQTRFTSSPDVFAVNQSCGWKSSSLQTEEHMEAGGLGPRSKEVRLRATVLLGFV